MNARQAQFAAEYVKDRNATQAAIRAGYSPKTAGQQGEQLLKNLEIAAYVAQRQQQALDDAGVTAKRVIDEISLHSFSNVQDLFDEAGNLRPIHTLTRAQAACISSLEIIKKNAEAGDGKTDLVHKVRVTDKIKSLEMLAKHFALLTENIHHTGSVDLVGKLQAARKRVSQR